MPRNKRAKVVSLTKTKKQVGRERKEEQIDKVRELVEQYKHIYVFETQNMRNAYLKELREELKPNTIFYFGKNTLTKVALGKVKEEAIKENIHKVGRVLQGDRGLIFSNDEPEHLRSVLAAHREPDFARSGFIPERKIELTVGPLPQFQGTMEPMLRKMGLMTQLKKGVIHLLKDFTVAKPGVALTPDQAHLLKLLGLQLSVFFIKLKCHYEDGQFTLFEDDSSSSSSAASSSNADDSD